MYPLSLHNATLITCIVQKGSRIGIWMIQIDFSFLLTVNYATATCAMHKEKVVPCFWLLSFCQILSYFHSGDGSKGMSHYFQFGGKEVDEKRLLWNRSYGLSFAARGLLQSSGLIILHYLYQSTHHFPDHGWSITPWCIYNLACSYISNHSWRVFCYLIL